MKKIKYFILIITILFISLLPLEVSAEETENIEITRELVLTYNEVTSFNIYPKDGYSILVYYIEDYFNIDNPYNIKLKSYLANKIEVNALNITYFYAIIGGTYYIDDIALIVDNNNLYILVNSSLKPIAPPNGNGQGNFEWTDFVYNSVTKLYEMVLLFKVNQSSQGQPIWSYSHKDYFNLLGLSIEFKHLLSTEDGSYYEYIYNLGFEDGEKSGYNSGYSKGYSVGYKEGKAYGESIADGEVNALASIIPNIVGTIWGVTKDFLSIEVYGISPWQILAALSSIALVLLAIKLIR